MTPAIGSSAGCAATGSSISCAWPPSRWGGMTIRRATALAIALPWSRARCAGRGRSRPRCPRSSARRPRRRRARRRSTSHARVPRGQRVGVAPVGRRRAALEQAGGREQEHARCRSRRSGARTPRRASRTASEGAPVHEGTITVSACAKSVQSVLDDQARARPRWPRHDPGSRCRRSASTTTARRAPAGRARRPRRRSPARRRPRARAPKRRHDAWPDLDAYRHSGHWRGQPQGATLRRMNSFAQRLAHETDAADVHPRPREPHRRRCPQRPRLRPGAHPRRALDPRRLPAGPLVVYCWGPGCNGATKAAARLTDEGRAVKEMLGGFEYWVREGFALEGTHAEELVRRWGGGPC